MNLTGKSLCLSEQETDHVKNVGPDIREDELLEVVANRDAIDFCKFLPGRNLKTGPKTTTDHGDP